ncbi:unnamed protein product [Penicillium nalgiovense]|nr:unnamed protein product [Penicillium nalgiovense]
MYTYVISITCVIWRKICHPGTLPARRWDLGRNWGLAVNIVGLCYSVFAMFWSFWPGELPVTAVNFNWSVVIFGTVSILSLIMYVVKGRNEYSGPAMDVKRED